MTPTHSEKSPASSPNESIADNPHYVLRRGKILGPFGLEELTKLVSAGTLEHDDFVQQPGSSEWLPLRWLLVPNDAQDLEGALAPTWRTLLKWAWLRLRFNLDERSLYAGWVSLALALGVLFLSRWPMLLWAPWAVLAFFGGVALYRRGRPGTGIALMIASALVPGALWAYFWTGVSPANKSPKSPPTAVAPAIPSLDGNAPEAPSPSPK